MTGAQGLIFAPHGSIQFSASSLDLDGSIIGYMIKSSSSSFDIHYLDDPGFTPEFSVELVS